MLVPPSLANQEVVNLDQFDFHFHYFRDTFLLNRGTQVSWRVRTHTTPSLMSAADGCVVENPGIEPELHMRNGSAAAGDDHSSVGSTTYEIDGEAQKETGSVSLYVASTDTGMHCLAELSLLFCAACVLFASYAVLLFLLLPLSRRRWA
jgi:hypothetical protein